MDSSAGVELAGLY